MEKLNLTRQQLREIEKSRSAEDLKTLISVLREYFGDSAEPGAVAMPADQIERSTQTRTPARTSSAAKSPAKAAPQEKRQESAAPAAKQVGKPAQADPSRYVVGMVSTTTRS